jgi:hypothetical protein
MDTFNFVVGIMFSQFGEDNFIHLVNFHFHNFSLMKINYEIHDKKIITIVDAFEEWRHLFEKVQHEIIVYLNHKNL